ncbi:arginase type II, partial [Suillus lakei]
IHLSFDVDAIDLNVVPSAGTLVSTPRSGYHICEAIHKTWLLVALDLMVCLLP